jgi:hypothetical protein
MFKALLITATFCLTWSFKPAFCWAKADFVTPVPSYSQPQIKGESTNDNPDYANFASSGFVLLALGVFSATVSSIISYRNKGKMYPRG